MLRRELVDAMSRGSNLAGKLILRRVCQGCNDPVGCGHGMLVGVEKCVRGELRTFVSAAAMTEMEKEV